MIEEIQTSSATFHSIGPSIRQEAKTVLYLALSAKDSLSTTPYFYPAKLLANSGYRVISIDLPLHENGQRPLHIQALWESHIDDVKSWIDRLTKNVEELEDKLSSPPALMSLSRGFIPASHLLAKCETIDTLLAFAPLTKLPHTKALDTHYLAPMMAHKKVLIYIGHEDPVVHTSQVIHTAGSWITQSQELGVDRPHIEVIIKPSIGKDGHNTHRTTFEQGVAWLKTNL